MEEKSIVTRLQELSELLNSGVLNQEEFEALKSELLYGVKSNTPPKTIAKDKDTLITEGIEKSIEGNYKEALDLFKEVLRYGKLAEEIFEHVAADKLSGPIFVKGYPIDTSPLVRAHREIPGVAEKWDLYIDGFELATGYSELIDPVIQRERLTEQAALGSKGDLEAMQIDEDFLRAMEYAMPPMGGMGMGADRLLMALTGLGIRETILFPLVKPEES